MNATIMMIKINFHQSKNVQDPSHEKNPTSKIQSEKSEASSRARARKAICKVPWREDIDVRRKTLGFGVFEFDETSEMPTWSRFCIVLSPDDAEWDR
jgi:hypothetical protein